MGSGMLESSVLPAEPSTKDGDGPLGPSGDDRSGTASTMGTGSSRGADRQGAPASSAVARHGDRWASHPVYQSAVPDTAGDVRASAAPERIGADPVDGDGSLRAGPDTGVHVDVSGLRGSVDPPSGTTGSPAPQPGELPKADAGAARPTPSEAKRSASPAGSRVGAAAAASGSSTTVGDNPGRGRGRGRGSSSARAHVSGLVADPTKDRAYTQGRLFAQALDSSVRRSRSGESSKSSPTEIPPTSEDEGESWGQWKPSDAPAPSEVTPRAPASRPASSEADIAEVQRASDGSITRVTYSGTDTAGDQ